MQSYDYLLDISTNTVKYINPKKFEIFLFEHDEREDYIVGMFGVTTPNQLKEPNEIEFSSYEMLVRVLNIGRFIHNEILKSDRFFILNDDMGIIREDENYDYLISEILDFCSVYGSYNLGSIALRSMEILSENFTPEDTIKLKVSDFLCKASNLYMLIKGVQEEKDYIYMEIAKKFFRVSVFGANLKISPVLTKDRMGNNKLLISYDFYDLFDLMTYQLLLILVNGENKIGLCPYCNTFFVSKRKKLYCTPSHANAMSRNRNESERKICEQCGSFFLTSNGNRVYCSDKCKKRSQYLRYKSKGRDVV